MIDGRFSRLVGTYAISWKCNDLDPLILGSDPCDIWATPNTMDHGIQVRASITKGSKPPPKLYIPSTLNIDLILWHTQYIVCAVKC